jgi:hypothetical protein
MHYHICRPCGTVWGHTQSPDWSSERFDAEHTCPQCGSTKCCTKWDDQNEAAAACASPELTPREIENANYEAMEAKYGIAVAEFMWRRGIRA